MTHEKVMMRAQAISTICKVFGPSYLKLMSIIFNIKGYERQWLEADKLAYNFGRRSAYNSVNLFIVVTAVVMVYAAVTNYLAGDTRDAMLFALGSIAIATSFIRSMLLLGFSVMLFATSTRQYIVKKKVYNAVDGVFKKADTESNLVQSPCTELDIQYTMDLSETVYEQDEERDE